MKKQKIEDIFSSIENFSSVPPPELWSKIEEELDKPKKKKRVVLWWSAAACLLLGLLLPAVLHFSSDSGIKTINNGNAEKSVVVDKNKKNSNNKNISTENNIIKKETVVAESSAIENATIQSNNEQKNKAYKTNVTKTSDTKMNSGDITTDELNNNIKNNNQAVAEKTLGTQKQNSFNSYSNKQLPNSVKENKNKAVAEKTFSIQKQNSFNSYSNNQLPNSVKENENKAVAEKTFSIQKQNSFNSYSNNQLPNSVKENENKDVAEKTFGTQKQNSFNSYSNNQLPNSVKENENKAVAEKTFGNEKYNSANTFSNNLTPNSVVEEKKTSTTTAIIALNSSNSTEKNNSQNKEEAVTETVNSKAALAQLTQKNNITLTKQDSIQLVQLQNLEKGIAEVEPKKEKETKPVSNDEKWSLEVFAGIANSENYGKQKTLGNVNESKQTNSYGVKTNYKLNKKWAVSSGLKFNELGQSIANVPYYSNYEMSSSPLTSDNLHNGSNVIAPKITSNSNYVFVSRSTQNTLKSDNVESGNIDQSLKYIEMPLEVSYSLFNKNKTNISLNTGGFVGKLISNDVTLNGNSIGGNLNANDFVYGSLLSSTFQYQLYKKTHIFVEPGMNYYINPLNNQTFNQFQWSFNFGLNVSF
ncbi:hypothetical protein AAEO57_13790 [Flavobacterium sp. DGU38]|uniref:Outer membrane protein beta-barrel domain-containing protein n=1 Tax=Flavobacterium calami TaxID=3139144 RepID=A0ABU9ISL0_9FLAO